MSDTSMNNKGFNNTTGGITHISTPGSSSDILNLLNPSEHLLGKMTHIKDSLGGAKGIMWANQFQKAWNRVGTYSNQIDQEHMYEKLSQINYTISVDGQVGIKGIQGVDRSGKVYSVEPTTKDIIQKYLGSHHPHLFYHGGVIRNSHKIDTFDMQNSKIGENLVKRTDYLITKKEVEALSKWANNDGYIIMDLFNITQDQVNDYTHIWAADDDDVSIHTQHTLAISNDGTLVFPGWKYQSEYCYIYGFQDDSSV